MGNSHRILRFLYTLFLAAIFVLPGLVPQKNIPISKLKPIIDISFNTVKNSTNIPIQEVGHFVVSDIIAQIQESRQSISLQEFISDETFCQNTPAAFEVLKKKGSLDKEDLREFCSDCAKTAYVVTEGNYNIEGQESWMKSVDIKQTILSDYSNICVHAEKELALVLLGTKDQPTQQATQSNPSSTPIPQQAPQSTTAPKAKNFSEQELWQALIDYRHAHEKPDLLPSEKLCSYAGKRIDEHIEMFAEKPKEEYNNQDKYPLDAHAGFQRDGESGHLFDVTGFDVIAENLAYWPTAEFPHQVIEWGWDTSTEGHKEAQLSTEYNHACLSGRDGFYVAIFAR
ncbi:hypothetical protein ACFL1M_01810 [Patescibacteria group bacterium]